MNDRKLFKETFSPMRVSEEAISEVMKMTQSKNKKLLRLPQAVAGLCACLVLVLGLAVTANAATGGELFDGIAGMVLDIFQVNDYKGIGVSESGEEFTLMGTNVDLIAREGRAILVVGEDEEDITDALTRDGAYTYERTSGGTVCRVEVTGTPEDWKLEMAVFDEGDQPAITITRASDQENIQIRDADGEVLVVEPAGNRDGEDIFFGMGDSLTTTSSTYSFPGPEG